MNTATFTTRQDANGNTIVITDMLDVLVTPAEIAAGRTPAAVAAEVMGWAVDLQHPDLGQTTGEDTPDEDF